MVDLNSFADKESFFEEQFVVSIQTPTRSVDEFAKVLGDNIELIQGNYSHCMYIRSNGYCRFKGNDGSHSGAETAVQEVPSAEIVIAIPHEVEALRKLVLIINKYHVHEEPTKHVHAVSWNMQGPMGGVHYVYIGCVLNKNLATIQYTCT